MEMKTFKIGLLPRILVAMVLGIVGGMLSAAWLVRLFITFNALFSQLLGFLIPLIIIGLVTSAIADIGRQAGRLLLLTVVIAYADTVFCGLLSYGTGQVLFPSIVSHATAEVPIEAAALQPYFTIKIPPMVDIMSALIFSFIVGNCIAHSEMPTLRQAATEFKEVVSRTISHLLIPLLPVYIFGLFLSMTFSGQVWHIMMLFANIIVIIIVLHIFILLYQFVIAGV